MSDIDTLTWIYHHLTVKCGENLNRSYIIRFSEIIQKMREKEKADKLLDKELLEGLY